MHAAQVVKNQINPVERIKYLADNYSRGDIKHPGARADDSVIIAYDSLLASDGNFEKLIVYSILHHGDSDTVGSIAGSWYGTYYLDEGIHNKNFEKELEVVNEIDELTAQKRLQEIMMENVSVLYQHHYDIIKQKI